MDGWRLINEHFACFHAFCLKSFVQKKEKEEGGGRITKTSRNNYCSIKNTIGIIVHSLAPRTGNMEVNGLSRNE